LEAYLQILVSGLTLGAMYAVGTIGLSLAWGALKMLNMAHSSLIAIGGYASYAVVVQAGLPGMAALPAALIAGALVGALLYYAVVRFMYRNEAFETNVFIATFGIALVLENLVLKLFGAYPLKQPFAIAEGFRIGTVHVPWQNLLIFGVSVLTMLLMAWGLARTRTGRAIRATAQNREAAQLMGVATGRIFAQVLAIAGALAAMSGVLLSSIATLSPQLGFDPMLKAFIICVIAGLGNIAGALYAAFALGLFEAVVQYFLGVRWALPLMMMLVIVALIWRPYGVFGQRQVTRL
jgi:branched-subunit amino acid ABC-type transport system permease component